MNTPFVRAAVGLTAALLAALAPIAASAQATPSYEFRKVARNLVVSAVSSAPEPGGEELAGSPGTPVVPSGYVAVGGLTYTKPGETALKWSSAVTYCSGTFDGSTGWRLPTPTELQAVYNNRAPLQLSELGWNMGVRYWTNESSGGGATYVDFLTGATGSKSTIVTYYVTCVK